MAKAVRITIQLVMYRYRKPLPSGVKTGDWR